MVVWLIASVAIEYLYSAEHKAVHNNLAALCYFTLPLPHIDISHH